MKWILLLLTMAAVRQAAAQNFPESFAGRWRGTLQWYRSGSDTAREVEMRLDILPADTAGQYTWKMQYGTQDVRPYLLKPVDRAKGHWVVDERNGLLLDAFWIGQRLTSSFSTGGTTIVNTHYLEGESMIVEFYAYPAKPLNTTRANDAEATVVDNYRVVSFQRAVLQKLR